MASSWLFAILFVGSFTYTVVDLIRRLEERREFTRRHQAHRRWR